MQLLDLWYFYLSKNKPVYDPNLGYYNTSMKGLLNIKRVMGVGLALFKAPGLVDQVF